MGNDMHTAGSRLRLRDEVIEADLVRFAVEVLQDPSVALSERIDESAAWAATTLEGLFAAFNMLVVRDSNGQVVSCFGYDDRYNHPEPLFHAISPGVANGSWIAYNDDVRAYLVIFQDGVVRSDWDLEEKGVDTWSREAVFPSFLVPPPTDRSSEVTAMVRHLTGQADLPTGLARPACSDYLLLRNLLDNARPWQLDAQLA